MIKYEKRTFVSKIEYITIIVFSLIVIASIVQSIITKNTITTFKAIGTLALIYVPLIISKKIKINLIPEFNIIIQIFIFLGVYLGSVCELYYKFWWLDGTLHGARGVLLGFTGFILIFMSNKNEIKSSISLSFIIMFMFSFSAGVSVLWEIFEFTMDSLFNTSMQFFGLVDTMWDIIADSIGSISSAIVIYLYLKFGKETYIIKLISKFLVSNKNKFEKIEKIGTVKN